MTPAIAKIVFVMLAIGWYLVRYEYARRSRREKDCTTPEVSGKLRYCSYLFRPWYSAAHFYVGTAFPHFAAYTFQPVSGLAGTFLCDCGFGHVSTDASGARPELVDQSYVREDHQLVTNGVYQRIGPPMYSAF